MTWQLTVASHIPALGWNLQQCLSCFISNCATSFIALGDAAACGILEYDTRERLEAMENHAPSLPMSGRGTPGTQDNCRGAAAPETSRRNSRGKQLAPASRPRKEPRLALQEGFVLSFGRGTNTYSSWQQSERIHPHEHVSPGLAKPPHCPQHSQGDLVRRSLTQAWAAVKTMAGKKKPISKITLYFFSLWNLLWCIVT